MRTPRSVRPLGGLVAAVLLGACGGSVPFPGLGPDEIFDLGVQAFEEGDWGEAIRAFERALIMPNFQSAPEARLYIGRAYFNDEKFILARSEYQRVLDRYPADTVASHASLGVCESYAASAPRIERDQRATESAWSSCGNVARDYAGTLVGLRAAEIQLEMYNQLAYSDYYTGGYFFKRRMFDSALIYYEDVLDQYPDSRYAPCALYRMVLAFERIGYEIDADEHRDRLLQSYPDSPPARLLREEDGGSPECTVETETDGG